MVYLTAESAQLLADAAFLVLHCGQYHFVNAISQLGYISNHILLLVFKV